VREEYLNTHWFSTISQARHIIAAWQHHYDAERPRGSLGRQTPEELRLIYPSPMTQSQTPNTSSN